MSGPLAVLLNPAAGRGTARVAATEVLERLRASGVDAQPVPGDNASRALDALRRAVAAGVSGVVATGGDGTVHLAANAVAGTGVPLGVVPLGTGNDAARCFGLPMSVSGAVDGIVTALRGDHVPATVDAVRAADRWYVGVLAAGFDARVNARANAMRWPTGPRRYELAVLAELGVFRPIGYSLELDGESIELDGMLVAVGNIASYGGGMQMCAGADPHDGLLDVVIAHRMTRATLLRLLLAVRSGGHLRHPAVELRRARVVSISTRDPAGLLAYADGEPLSRLPLTAEVVPAALTLLAPPRSRAATPP